MTSVANKTVCLAVFWKFFERISVQAVGLLVSIILARLLTPDDFGAVAILLIFISLGQVFVIGGFNTALIQKKNVEDKDFSTVFLFSIGVTTVLYLLTWCFSGIFARWFSIPSLATPLKVLALILIPNGIVAVQEAFATKKMDFRSIFLAHLFSVSCSGVIGISLAYCGIGLWAIICYHLLHASFTMFFLFLLVAWRPRLKFCMESFKNLCPFGTKMLCCNLMVTIFMDIRGILIGKVGNPAELAFFDRGKIFPATFMGIIGQVLQTVLLPVMSQKQDDIAELQKQMRQSIRICVFATIPCLLILIAVSKLLILFLLTEKWLPAVFFLNCFALTYLFHPAQYVTFEALKARGFGSQCIWIEVIRKTIEIATLVIAIPYGVKALAATVFLNGVISFLIMMPFNVKYLGYKLKWQLADQFVFFLAGGMMFASLYFLDKYVPDFLLKWFGLSITGFIIYFVILLILRNDIAFFILNKLKAVTGNFMIRRSE